MQFGVEELLAMLLVAVVVAAIVWLPRVSNALEERLRDVVRSDEDDLEDEGLDMVDRLLVTGMVVLGASWVGLWIATG